MTSHHLKLWEGVLETRLRAEVKASKNLVLDATFALRKLMEKYGGSQKKLIDAGSALGRAKWQNGGGIICR